MCTFWYVECLARAGRLEEAQLAFEMMLTYANHLGLYSEQIGPNGELLGNFPQAFTHLGLISAAISLDRQLSRQATPANANVTGSRARHRSAALLGDECVQGADRRSFILIDAYVHDLRSALPRSAHSVRPRTRRRTSSHWPALRVERHRKARAWLHPRGRPIEQEVPTVVHGMRCAARLGGSRARAG